MIDYTSLYGGLLSKQRYNTIRDADLVRTLKRYRISVPGVRKQYANLSDAQLRRKAVGAVVRRYLAAKKPKK